MPVLSGRTAWPVGIAVDTASASTQCADDAVALSRPCHTPFCGLPAADLPPAGGIGDRGIPCKRAKCTFALCLRHRRWRRRWPRRARRGSFKRLWDFNYFPDERKIRDTHGPWSQARFTGYALIQGVSLDVLTGQSRGEGVSLDVLRSLLQCLANPLPGQFRIGVRHLDAGGGVALQHSGQHGGAASGEWV